MAPRHGTSYNCGELESITMLLAEMAQSLAEMAQDNSGARAVTISTNQFWLELVVAGVQWLGCALP